VPLKRSATLLWVGITGAVIGLMATAIWLLFQFSGGDLDRSDKLASIVSMSVSITTLPLSVIAIVVTLRQGRQGSTGVANISAHLDAMTDVLAVAVRTQWEAEEQVRRIHDPFPLPTRWSNAAEELMDHWQNINGALDRQDPTDLSEHRNIVDAFNHVPSGRLVVLGRVGAGKTILTSRFVLTLLSDRASGADTPVPVIFGLGSWDPTMSALNAWLAEQLTTVYPILADRDTAGTTVAAQLLATGRIMPVLDGFDEISEGLRVDAVNGINAELRPGLPFLLTSRPGEYADAVRSGDVITAAAVVRLDDLAVADLADYLPLTTRKGDTHTGRTKWHPVIDHMLAAPRSSPLTVVLSTPLMVSLARSIFSDTSADPTELLALASVTEVEERLLTGFLPAVYFGAQRVGDRFSVGKATRWLQFLATHLHRLNSYDLAWWQLVYAVPRVAVGLVAGFVITFMAWLAGGALGLLGDWTGTARTTWISAGLVGAAIAGVAGGVIVGEGRGIRPSPARMRLRIAGRLGRVRRDLTGGLRSWRTMIWLLVWCLGGTVFGLGAFLFINSDSGLAVGPAAGLFAGFGIWFVVTTVRALGAPVDPTETVSPSELLRTDRTTALRQGALVGIGGAGVFWLMLLFAFEPAFGHPFGVVFAHGLWLLGWLIDIACGMLIWILFVTVWGPWLIARFWLPLTGRLPWSVMTFLADAHKRGALRQTGGLYQFRHARLQNHLVAQARAPSDSSTNTPMDAHGGDNELTDP
jgi:NACHT domain-containing protein